MSAPAPAPAPAPLEAALAALSPFGLYQRYTLLMLCLPNLLAPIYSLNYIFVADTVPFRCMVPECEGEATPGPGQYHNTTVSALLPPNDPCRRYNPLHDPLVSPSSCDRGDYHPTDTQPCLHFVYENIDTTYAEFNLACREWMRTLVGTVRNSALPVALVLTGFLSDKYGRRTALCTFGACTAILGVVKACSINYEMYLAMEFLEAALGYGFNTAAYVMMVELARPSLRGTFACASGVAYGAGGVLFAWLAWRLVYWRRLLLVAHLLALLLPLYSLLVDESVRWLHAKGRLHDTERIIRKSARWNKIILDEELMRNLHKSDETDSGKVAEPRENPWLGVLKSRVLLTRMAVCSWCWIAVAFVYYGLTINSVSLSGDKYVNFALNMAMEIVASLLLMMSLERIGRKWSIFVAFLLCGAACVTPFIVDNEEVMFGMYFVGKLSITFAFNSIYVYTAELFPTSVRSSALAACSLVGRLGSVLAPQTPLLSVGVQATLYGACCSLAALAVLGAPETRRAPLPPDTRSAETLHPPAPAPPPPPAAPTLRRVLSADT